LERHLLLGIIDQAYLHQLVLGIELQLEPIDGLGEAWLGRHSNAATARDGIDQRRLADVRATYVNEWW